MSYTLLCLLLFVPSSAVLIQGVSAQETLYFDEEFSDSTLNSTKWNTEIAINGSRWCATNRVDHLSGPGEWLDVSSQPCHSVTQSPPYGNIVVSDGFARFASDSSYTFPYIWSGNPLHRSPFPESGDFFLEIRMKYDRLSYHGNGILVTNKQNNDPAGINPPLGPYDSGIGIWGDSSGLLLTGGGDLISNMTADPNIASDRSFHDYTLVYRNGTYSLFVDGKLFSKPVQSNTIPNTISIGNPIITHWGIQDWSSITIDYIRIGQNTTNVASEQTESLNLFPPFLGGQ